MRQHEQSTCQTLRSNRDCQVLKVDHSEVCHTGLRPGAWRMLGAQEPLGCIESLNLGTDVRSPRRSSITRTYGDVQPLPEEATLGTTDACCLPKTGILDHDADASSSNLTD